MTSTAWLMVLLTAPLLGFLINGWRFRTASAAIAGTIGTTAAGTSFLASVVFFFELMNRDPGNRAIRLSLFDWITVGDFNIPAVFVVDSVSVLMLLVVTGVGSLIHLFSIAYMSHDERPAKYFAYLNLFLFNMLLLVLGGNLLIMFIGWEGVGLCSYLLIGFWFKDESKAAAGMKAFVVNRIGDAGFLLGIFTLLWIFGTVDFAELGKAVANGGPGGWASPITWACLFLFVGATGKSAQIPLYVWLPDAMAGPTPVSALIHAATMVTAGVYMIIRLNPLFMVSPEAMGVIAVVGALTALLAATIGLAQNDIKKVLAYSTVSQLGYMFLAVGVGAFIPALFHLITHAFFKALMFLGSGSVIHAMHEEQNIRKMGGLSKYLPITYFTFLLGWLAIIGMPPFAGFFSKDEILWVAYQGERGSPLLWLVGLFGAGLTAFYMTRLMALVFWGQSRVPKGVHPHESPPLMTIPLIILGVLSIVGGWIGIPHVLSAILPGHPTHWLDSWLQGAVPSANLRGEPGHHAFLEYSLMAISVSVAGLAGALAYYLYILQPQKIGLIVKDFKVAYRVVYNKYYVDEFYDRAINFPLVRLSKGLWAYIDVNFIDRLTYLISDTVRETAGGLSQMQSGNFQRYALFATVGCAVVLVVAFLVGI